MASQIKSGTIGVFDLGSGAIIAGQLGSGSVQSGNIGSGVVASGHMASGFIGSLGGGTADISSGANSICDLRMSLNSELSVPISGDVITQTISSGRTTSGTTTLFMTSGITTQSGLCPGMLVVGSGIPVGTFITDLSGFTSIGISNAATHATSGAAIQFIAGAIYAVGHVGNRITLYDGTLWTIYNWISGTGSRILTYDNRQVTLMAQSGAGNFNAKLSGLTDTFQLVPGMLAVASGYISSGTVITTIDGATNVTISANTISGGPNASGVPILFMLPPTSGTVSSGANFDVYAVLRSGVPWLEFGNQWQTTTARLDPVYQQDGVWANSGVVN